LEFSEKCSMPDDRSNHRPMAAISVSTQGVEKLLSNLNPTKAAGTRWHPTPSPERACQRSCPNPDQDLPVITADRRGAERLEREALVKPVFRKGEHYNPANHRPISLTSIPCKLLEHILVSSIMQHLESNSILSPPTAWLSKEQILQDAATQIYQRSLSSNGEMYHNRGHHNGLHQSFRPSQPQPPGAQGCPPWHPRSMKTQITNFLSK